MTQPKGREPGIQLDQQTTAMARLRFDKYWMPITFCGCWAWLGGSVGTGYGRFYLPAAANFAHRAAWLLYRGPIPAGVFVCHECDVRCCVNPDHLFLGTSSDNLRDMMRKGRAGFQKNPAAYVLRGKTMVARGQRHDSSILSDADVRVVLYLAERGAFTADIAKVFGVASATISDIVLGRTHRSVQ